MLTTSQAWAKIAEAFERKVFTGVRFDAAAISNFGLCSAVNKLQERAEITREQQTAMHEQIEETLVEAAGSDLPREREIDGAHPYLWKYNAAGDEHRILLAQSFSEVTR